MSKFKTRQEYIDFQKSLNKKYIELRNKMREYCTVLLNEDEYMKFLHFFSKWTHYSSYNILLLYMQYPDASYIAGFKRWKELSFAAGNPESHQILRLDQRQKGIELLIPFSLNYTHLPTRNRFLGYQCISVFDVSQVNDIPIKTGFKPYVPLEQMDFNSFVFVMRDCLAGKGILMAGNMDDPMFLYKDVYMQGNTIIYNDMVTEKKTAIFDNVISIIVEELINDLSKEKKELLYLSVCYVLYLFYGFPDGHDLKNNFSKIRLFSAEEFMDFFHILQLAVQKCIYYIFKAYKKFLSEFQVPSNEEVLKKIEMEIEREIRNEYLGY